MDKSLPILVTGAKGFVGKNLVCRLNNEGYTNILLYDIDTPKEQLASYANKACFVYHLAGVNRPQNPEDFYTGNRGLTEELLAILRAKTTQTPFLITSSAQAALDNDYGKSKKEAETAVFAYSSETGAKVYVYRLPGVFGKWCRPSYNSVIATFCYNVAHDLPCEVRDENYSLPLVYIDDVVKGFISALDDKVLKNDDYCEISPVHTTTLRFLAKTLLCFRNSRQSLAVPNMDDAFTKKLYSTYLSYLDTSDFAYGLTMNSDERGSFTEFLRTEDRGQVSINISRPHITKGNHWHDSKNEKFLVVRGSGVIRFRAVNSAEIHEYFVNGDELTVVDIPTGYTHNIENIGEEDMVTVMWANEAFDKETPDTYFLKV